MPTISIAYETGASNGSVTVGVASDVLSLGNLHWYASLSNAPPSEGDLIAGTGAVSFGSVAKDANATQGIYINGLSADTTYYIYFLHADGTNSNIVSSSAITTDPTTGVSNPVVSSLTASSLTISVDCDRSVGAGALMTLTIDEPANVADARYKIENGENVSGGAATIALADQALDTGTTISLTGVDISSLTEGTDYQIALFISDDNGNYSNPDFLVTPTFTVPSSGSEATITGVSSTAGADTVQINNQLTITVNDTTGITGAAVNGIALTSLVIVDAITLTADVGLGVNANIATSVNVTVDNGAISTGYPATVALPTGYSAATLAVDYVNLSPDSSFYNEAVYSALSAGDVWVHDNLGGTVSYDDNLVASVNPALTVDTDVPGWFFDQSDSYAADASITTDRLLAAGPDTTKPVITLVGALTINLAVGSSYNELGATSIDNVDGDISGSVVINSSSVNTAAAGSYSVTYNVSDAAGNSADQVTRTVVVSVTADTTKPVITLVGASTINLIIGSSYNELGATATDNVDGDISGSVVINSSSVNTAAAGSYSVTYNVSDAAGNSADQVTRTVVVSVTADTTKPVITLVGAPTVNLSVGSSYNEPGATATDNVDGDISSSIAINSSGVNTAVAGSYSVTYNVSDVAGNSADQIIRTVIVSAIAQAPVGIFGGAGRTGCYKQINGAWSKTTNC
jgi:Bacterial surface protein, Ig-like domain